MWGGGWGRDERYGRGTWWIGMYRTRCVSGWWGCLLHVAVGTDKERIDERATVASLKRRKDCQRPESGDILAGLAASKRVTERTNANFYGNRRGVSYIGTGLGLIVLPRFISSGLSPTYLHDPSSCSLIQCCGISSVLIVFRKQVVPSG